MSRTPAGGLGGLDGLGAAFNGLVDVDLVAVEVDVLPGKRRRLAGPEAGVEDRQDPQARPVLLGEGQDVAALGGGDGPVAALGAFGQLKPLGGVEDDEAGAAGLAEQLLQDHAELGDVGVGPPGLGVQDGLQVQVPHVLELLLADGGADVAVVLLVIQAQTLGRDAGGDFVGLHPLLEPLLHGGLSAGGELPPLQRDDEVGQLLAGLLLRLAPDLVAAAVPGDRLANIRVLFHQ